MRTIIFLITFFIGKIVSGQTNEWPRAGFNTNWQDFLNFSSGVPFTNLCKLADPFIGAEAYDQNGYPTMIGAESASSLIYTGNALPEGIYTLAWEGNGEISLQTCEGIFSFGTEDDRSQPIDLGCTFGQEAFVQLEIRSTDPQNHIRNIRLYLPGFENTSELLTPWYLDFFQPGGVSRMMDFGWTNENTLVEWSDRPRLDTYSYGGDSDANVGVALEYMIDLCNETQTHLWYNFPDRVNDNYVREAARLIQDRLDPSLNVWVELSNEVWNGQFFHDEYFDTLSTDFGLPAIVNDEPVGALHRYAARASQIIGIVEEEFIDDSRVVGILAGAASFDFPLEVETDAIVALGQMDRFDAFAIAPYFAGGPEFDPISEHFPDMNAVFQAIDQLIRDDFSGANFLFNEVLENIEVAERFGKRMVTYEGGQHFTAEGDSPYTEQQVVAINTDPRIYDTYQLYLDEWVGIGGSTLMFYTSFQPNNEQAFGHKTSWAQPLEEAHKYRAILDWLNGEDNGEQEFPSVVTSVIEESVNAIVIYPNPTSDYLNFSSTEVSFIEIFDSRGAKVMSERVQNQVDVSSLSEDIYFVYLYDESNNILHSSRIVTR